MFFQRLNSPGLAINSYLIGCKKSQVCCVVDPTRLVTPYIVAADNAGLKITHILETHLHADFISGATELKQQLGGKAQIYASGFGGKEWVPSYADVVIHQGDLIKLGSIHLEPLHTPGHTPEHLTWLCYDENRTKEEPWFALTGDFLFVGGVGRPDLCGDEAFKTLSKQLYQSVFTTIKNLPDYLEIFPAHGEGSFCGNSMNGCASSTLGFERRFNPFLQQLPETQWIEKLVHELPLAPPYFKRVKKTNLEGPPLLSSLQVERIDEDKLNQFKDDSFLLDIRPPSAFAEYHIKGSINIPGTLTFTSWAGWFVPADRPIVLISESENRLQNAVDQLRLIGIDSPVLTFILRSENQKIQEWTSLETVGVEGLKNRKWENILVLDVRTPYEWSQGHIEGAQHAELQNLFSTMHLLPQDRMIATICHSGSRSSTAASLLKKYGFSNVANIRGGMAAWEQLKSS